MLTEKRRSPGREGLKGWHRGRRLRGRIAMSRRRQPQPPAAVLGAVFPHAQLSDLIRAKRSASGGLRCDSKNTGQSCRKCCERNERRNGNDDAPRSEQVRTRAASVASAYRRTISQMSRALAKTEACKDGRRENGTVAACCRESQQSRKRYLLPMELRAI